jgi:hypothetical protein
MDHDQRFKTLIREFFADFLRLFFAQWAERFDLNSVEWLDKELLPDPPEGSRHVLDLLSRIRTRSVVAGQPPDDPQQWLALIHIEIESPDKSTLLKPRLPGYYIHLREQHECPVLPIVIYLKVGLDGIGIDLFVERFWELETLTFRYLYVGLPGLDGIQYVEGDNWLGVALAALMRIPQDRVVWLGEQALRRLAMAPLSEQQRFLLSECVEAYLPVTEEQKEELKRQAVGVSSKGATMANKTSYDFGVEEATQTFLEGKFGVVPEAVRVRLKSYSYSDLKKLIKAIPRASSYRELGLDESQVEDSSQRTLTANKTSYDYGVEDGLEKAALLTLEGKFGIVPEAVQALLKTYSPADFQKLLKAIPKASSLKELGLEE